MSIIFNVVFFFIIIMRSNSIVFLLVVVWWKSFGDFMGFTKKIAFIVISVGFLLGNLATRQPSWVLDGLFELHDCEIISLTAQKRKDARWGYISEILPCECQSNDQHTHWQLVRLDSYVKPLGKTTLRSSNLQLYTVDSNSSCGTHNRTRKLLTDRYRSVEILWRFICYGWSYRFLVHQIRCTY